MGSVSGTQVFQHDQNGRVKLKTDPAVQFQTISFIVW